MVGLRSIFRRLWSPARGAAPAGTPDEAAGHPLHGARPLFVLGPPRSGTTLVAKVLNAHPRVLVTNETRVLTFFEHAFRDIPTGDRGGLHCAREHGAEVSAALRAHGASIVRDAYARIAAATGRSGLAWWGDKNPHLASCLELADAWFPDAAYVVVRRDPRDTVASILELWARMELVPARDPQASRWDVTDAKLTDVARSVARTVDAEDRFLARRAPPHFVLRYETLVGAPELVLDPLFVGFLGLADAEAPRRRLGQLAGVDVHGAVRGRVDFGERSVGRWRRDFDAGQAALLDAELAVPIARHEQA